MPMILATPELSDAGTLTTNSEVAGLPATNLQRTQPFDRWRSNGLGTANLDFDLGSAQSISLIWLGYSNLTKDAIWTLQGDDEPTFAFPRIYDAGVLGAFSGLSAAFRSTWERVHAFHFIDPPVSARYWRAQLSDSANPDGYIQAGRMYLAGGWTPTRGLDLGENIIHVDLTEIRRSLGASSYARDRGSFRRFGFGLRELPKAEIFDELARIERTRRGKDVLAILDKSDSATRLLDTAIYGRLSGSTPIVNSRHGIYRKDFRVDEMEHP